MFKFTRIRNFTTYSEKTLEQFKVANEKFNKKIKGTFLEKWVNYWKQIGRDYRDVVVSLRQDMRDKPIQSTFVVTGLGFLAYCGTHNPNKQSFRAKYVQCANDVALISTTLANPVAMDHLKYIEKCFNANLIRHTNLGIASIIWVDQYSDECDTYESNCSYLKIRYRKFSERILDVGFLNIWWVISRKMLDYDINY